MNIKCIGCYQLRRQQFNLSHGVEILYDCDTYFPYMTSIGGLLRPASGILEAVKDCPEDPLSHCILCQQMTDLLHCGQHIVSICKEHDIAWGKWLDEHPDRRTYLAPKNRLRKANWVEVFREFIEDIRARKFKEGKAK